MVTSEDKGSDATIMSQQGTVARSPKEIVAFFYLQQLEDTLRSEKAYMTSMENTSNKNTSLRHWAAALNALLTLCRPRMEERKKTDYEADKIQEKIDKQTEEGLKEATKDLVAYLNLDLKLTDIAKIQEYDRTNIILSNKIKGYKG